MIAGQQLPQDASSAAVPTSCAVPPEEELARRLAIALNVRARACSITLHFDGAGNLASVETRTVRKFGR